MAVSDEQYARLVDRLEALEQAINLFSTAVTKLATLEQLRQLHVIKQRDIEELKVRMSAAESSITTLQSYHVT